MSAFGTLLLNASFKVTQHHFGWEKHRAPCNLRRLLQVFNLPTVRSTCCLPSNTVFVCLYVAPTHALLPLFFPRLNIGVNMSLPRFVSFVAPQYNEKGAVTDDYLFRNPFPKGSMCHPKPTD